MNNRVGKKDKARKKSEQMLKTAKKNLSPALPKTRVNKALKIFNISMSRLMEILAENNIVIDANPNTILEYSAMNILKEEFSKGDKLDVKNIVTDPSYEIIEWIRQDFNNINYITPETFENVIVSILQRQGFKTEKCGKTNQSDGGIDVIAFKKDIINIIIAIQVKHKANIHKKVTTGEVRDFVGAMRIVDYFTAGMLITNTFFTDDSKSIEEKLVNIELKDSKDIQQWLESNFTTSKKIDKEIILTKHNKINLSIE